MIDHSVQVDKFGTADSFDVNALLEFQRNQERYAFLKWGQSSLQNFRVVPPDTGIVHQVNLEYLAPVIFSGDGAAYPDTLVGTDSHTTMINGLGVVGWGVGGIEAEACMLGQPASMLLPAVVGFKLTGKLPAGSTATDLVLTVTQMLRKKGVVGKFVEFYGDGLSALSVADRATIANMAPEYGATIGVFPIDDATLDYLRMTNRPPELIALVEAYAKEQGLFRVDGAPEPLFSDTLSLDLAKVVPSLAGPKRPQDRIDLPDVKQNFLAALGGPLKSARVATNGTLHDGAVVIAAITSCTNTSNPSVMIAAGLLAKKAVERGLSSKPWVKTSLAPGSKVVMDYLNDAGLMPYLEKLKFNLVGYGCTTCIGNSGPLPDDVAGAVQEGKLIVAAVLSGNRNFEGRINSLVRANYLASPPLVVAYALAGSVDIDLANDPIGQDSSGKRRFSARDLAFAGGSAGRGEEIRAPGNVRQAVRGSVRRRRTVELDSGSGRRSVRLGRSIHLHQARPVFRNMADPARRGRSDRRARAGRAGGFGHHRSYFAGRKHRRRQSRRKISDLAGRQAGGF